MLLAAVSYRSAQNQMDDIRADFGRSFDAAIKDRSSSFVESAKDRIPAEKTKLWAIHEEVEVELSVWDSGSLGPWICQVCPKVSIAFARRHDAMTSIHFGRHARGTCRRG